MVTDRGAHLLLASAYCVEEPLELPRPFHVDVLLPDAGVQTPRELVARVHPDDVLDLPVMEGHEQLGPEGAVVDVPGAEEQGAQELQGHVVELDVRPDHVCQFLDDGAASPRLGRHRKEPVQDRRRRRCRSCCRSRL